MKSANANEMQMKDNIGRVSYSTPYEEINTKSTAGWNISRWNPDCFYYLSITEKYCMIAIYQRILQTHLDLPTSLLRHYTAKRVP